MEALVQFIPLILIVAVISFVLLRPRQKKGEEPKMYENSYKTARSVLWFTATVGWLAFVVGAFGLLVVLGSLNDLSEAGPFAGPMVAAGIGLSFSGILFGLILVAITQVSNAVLDQADISREMLKHMKADTEAA